MIPLQGADKQVAGPTGDALMIPLQGRVGRVRGRPCKGIINAHRSTMNLQNLYTDCPKNLWNLCDILSRKFNSHGLNRLHGFFAMILFCLIYLWNRARERKNKRVDPRED